MRRRVVGALRGRGGYTLIELLAVLTIFMVVVTALTQLFVSGAKAELDANRRFQAQLSALLAPTGMTLEALRRSVAGAGAGQAGWKAFEAALHKIPLHASSAQQDALLALPPAVALAEIARYSDAQLRGLFEGEPAKVERRVNGSTRPPGRIRGVGVPPVRGTPGRSWPIWSLEPLRPPPLGFRHARRRGCGGRPIIVDHSPTSPARSPADLRWRPIAACFKRPGNPTANRVHVSKAKRPGS